MNILLAIILMVTGALLSVLFVAIFEHTFIKLVTLVKNQLKLVFGKRPPIVSEKEFVLCNKKTTWIVLDGNGKYEYKIENIVTHYNSMQIELPETIKNIKTEIMRVQEERRKTGNKPYYWNGRIYYVERFRIGRTPLEENMHLVIWFRPSDYYTFLATNMSLDKNFKTNDKYFTLREKYLKDVDWTKPIKYFSSSFGIDIAIITSDDFLIVTERSEVLGSRPNELNISANENLSRILDQKENDQAPDIYRAAPRGIYEELGVSVEREKIIFLSFGVDTKYCQYGLLGFSRIPQTSDELKNLRSMGIKDKWENKKLHFVKFNIEEIINFIINNDPWAPAAIACIYHTLVHEFGKKKVDAYINKYFRT